MVISYRDRTWTATDYSKTWSFAPARGGRIEYGTGEVRGHAAVADGQATLSSIRIFWLTRMSASQISLF